MVDALRLARRLLTPDGLLIDLHPTASNETVEVGDRVTGFVDADAALRRHSAASRALEAAVSEGQFAVAATRTFDFFTYGDSIDELRDYILENWRDTRIARETVERTRAALAAAPGARPRVREHVLLTVLRY
jgi:hypothetical protein